MSYMQDPETEQDDSERIDWLVHHFADLLKERDFDAIDHFTDQCPDLRQICVQEWIHGICEDEVLVNEFDSNPGSAALELATGFVTYIMEKPEWMI